MKINGNKIESFQERKRFVAKKDFTLQIGHGEVYSSPMTAMSNYETLSVIVEKGDFIPELYDRLGYVDHVKSIIYENEGVDFRAQDHPELCERVSA